MRRTCHCGAKLEPHGDEGAKAGALHCNGCGCCFEEDGHTPRAGHYPCSAYSADPPPALKPSRTRTAPPPAPSPVAATRTGEGDKKPSEEPTGDAETTSED